MLPDNWDQSGKVLVFRNAVAIVTRRSKETMMPSLLSWNNLFRLFLEKAILPSRQNHQSASFPN